MDYYYKAGEITQYKFIKNEDQITNSYLEKLRELLLTDPAKVFDNDAESWRDFIHWNLKVDREHLVLPNEVMLIDREWNGVHCLMICKIQGWGHNPNPRVKELYKVIEIEKLRYWKAGYHLLPRL